MESTEKEKNQNNNNNKRNKSQTNLKIVSKDQNKVDNRPKVFSKGKSLPPIMAATVSNFRQPIYYQTTTSITHQISNNAATKKKKMEEDIDSLKQELALNRMDMNRKKNELNE